MADPIVFAPSDSEATDEELPPKALFDSILWNAKLSKQLSSILPLQPPAVRRRIKAMKKNQFEILKIETKYHEELYALELLMHERNQQYFEKRSAIINGTYEPTDEECDFKEIDVDEELNEKLKIEDLDEPVTDEYIKMDDNTKGIPGFWLQILRTNTVIGDQVHEHDYKVLKHLEDIKIKHLQGEMGFTLEFHFQPNEYFTNSILSKTYQMKIEMDKDTPLSFDGAEIYNSTGCTIDWKPGQDVTHRQVTKKQKNKQTGDSRSITQTVEVESFFHFFSPPVVPEESAEQVSDEIKSELLNDFQMGQYLRDHVIPNAVLYYTGERDDEDDDDDEDDEEEECEEEEETTRKVKHGKAREQPPECKQQ